MTDLYTASLLKLQIACRERGIDLRVNMLGGDALITRARQNLVARFLSDENATHLLFIDADIGFGPEQVFRLLDFNAPVSAAAYPIKRFEWEKVRAHVEAGSKPLASAALTYVLDFAQGDQIVTQDGFAKVRYAGTGFLMIQRQVLLTMMKRYPELHYEHEHGPQELSNDSKWRYALFNCLIDKETRFYLSEDFSFCHRWKDIGGEIWVDLKSRLTHVGSFNFEGDLTTQFTAVP